MSILPRIAIRQLGSIPRSIVLSQSWKLSDSFHYTRKADWEAFIVGLCYAKLPSGIYGPVIASWHTPRGKSLKPVCLALYYDSELQASEWKRPKPPWKNYIGNPLGPPNVINGDNPMLGYRTAPIVPPWDQHLRNDDPTTNPTAQITPLQRP